MKSGNINLVYTILKEYAYKFTVKNSSKKYKILL